MQAEHREGDLAESLRATDDAGCLTCAARYESVKPEK